MDEVKNTIDIVIRIILNGEVRELRSKCNRDAKLHVIEMDLDNNFISSRTSKGEK